jgi:hypothetical protein
MDVYNDKMSSFFFPSKKNVTTIISTIGNYPQEGDWKSMALCTMTHYVRYLGFCGGQQTMAHIQSNKWKVRTTFLNVHSISSAKRLGSVEAQGVLTRTWCFGVGGVAGSSKGRYPSEVCGGQRRWIPRLCSGFRYIFIRCLYTLASLHYITSFPFSFPPLLSSPEKSSYKVMLSFSSYHYYFQCNLTLRILLVLIF